MFWALVIFLAIVGCVALAWVTAGTIRSLAQLARAYLMPFFQPTEEQNLTKKFGPWAVVTGSTDGIGKEYAGELARQGLNIVLISRSLDKLRNTAAELEKEYLVKTKVIQADFSRGESVFQNIEDELRGLEIGILVNNVGKQYTYPTYLAEVPVRELWDIININVGAVTMMTRMMLPQMKARKRGAIVNVSSGSELQPLPLMTVYAATKTYVMNLTAAVRYEYGGYGVTVQHLCPLFIATKMNAFSDKFMTASMFVPDAKTYARHAVRTLGKMDSTTGYWAHGIQYFFTSTAPVWFRTFVGAAMNKNLREEYLAKIKSKET